MFLPVVVLCVCLSISVKTGFLIDGGEFAFYYVAWRESCFMCMSKSFTLESLV